jgi:hypothetical protein
LQCRGLARWAYNGVVFNIKKGKFSILVSNVGHLEVQMNFNSADLGNSHLSEFEDVTGLDITIEAGEGDCVLSLAQALGELNIVLMDEAERVIEPVLSSRVTPSEGGSILARAYRVARKGVYRLRVYAEGAAVTVIKFGRDILKYVSRKGVPTRGTCLFCTKTLLIVMMLAAHALVIPGRDGRLFYGAHLWPRDGFPQRVLAIRLG